ncbi:MAG TPA: Ku protein [Feifaniaceae bacterium]|nr:Ku protein [Feifaniaceae bacterium]
MQTVWKGAISFGLLNVPVKMGSATQKETIGFRQLHKACNTPINQKRFCSKCNKEVAYEDIVKGFEYEPGKFVLVTNDELDALPIKSAKYMDIVDFIHIGEVDPVYFDKTYYLWPEKGGEKAYLILREAMRQTGRVAVAKVTLREKEHLCLIRLIGDTISVAMMYFQDEIRDTAELGIAQLSEAVTVRPEEMDMAIQLVQNLTAEFQPEKYHDAYRDELLKLIRAKVEGKQVVEPESVEAPAGNVVDLMERLRQSVEATKAKNEPPASKEKKPRKRKAVSGE